MAVQPILSTDTLETGFRQKYNTTVNEIITGYQLLTDNLGAYTNTLRLIKFDGGFINIDLSVIYYTQAQIGALISGINSSPYSGAWANPSGTGYAVNAVVDYEGDLWRSTTLNNIDVPGTTGTWISVLTQNAAPIEVNLDDTKPQDYAYTYTVGNVSNAGLYIYAEMSVSINNPLTEVPETVYTPYPISYFKFSSNNVILLRRSDPGDIVKVTIYQL